MASTYSTNLALELIGTGEQSGTWGTTTNTNLGTLIEQSISGYVTQAITDGSGANTTITIPNGTTGVARNMFIEMTGALTFATTSLIVPANKKMYFIFNNTTGGFAVTVKVSGQTGILVPNGKKVILTCNGTDIVEAHTAIVGNATMGGTLGVTGATTLSSTLALGGTLDISGNAALGGGSLQAWSGFDALDLYGVSLVSTPSGTMSGGIYQNIYYDGANFKYIASQAAGWYYQSAGTHVWVTAPVGTAGNTATGTVRMSISTAGAVTIPGTLTAGQSALGLSPTLGGVGGGAALVAVRSNQSTAWGMEVSTSVNSAAGSFIVFVNATNTAQGSIQATNSTTTAYNTTSDMRLKENRGTATDSCGR
jgi:fibronectin-binding autotransporter adhesin